MRLTGIVSTVCVPLPDWFKWILGTTGKLRCVPCCGIYPKVRPNCPPRLFFAVADADTSAVAIADSIPDTCSDAFAVTHGDTITGTFSDTFGDTFGDIFTDTHKSAMQLLISGTFPEVSEISDTFAVTFSPPLQPHFILSSIPESVAYICYLSKTELINIAYLKRGYPHNPPCLN